MGAPPPHSSPVYKCSSVRIYVSKFQLYIICSLSQRMHTSVNRLHDRMQAPASACISTVRFTDHCMVEFNQISLIRFFAIVLAEADSFIYMYLFWHVIELNLKRHRFCFYDQLGTKHATAGARAATIGKNSLHNCQHL